MAAKTAVFLMGLAVPLLLVRRLSVMEFGVYKQVFLLIDTAVVVLPLGFALSAFFFFPREPERKAEVVRNILLVHAVMGSLGAALVIAFPWMPAALLNSRELAVYAPMIGVAMFLLVGASCIEFVAIANGEVHLAALILALSQLLRSALFVAAGVLFASVRALTYAAVIHGIFYGGIVAWYVRSRFSGGGWTFDWRLARAQVAYALPLAYAGIIWWLQGWVHHYFVSNRFDAAVYAVYAVGCLQLPILGVLLESVGYVAIRRASELRSRNETREIVRLVAGAVRSVAAVALPLYGVLLVTGREVITVLFTDQYRASWPIFAVYLTLIPLSITFPACDAVFRAHPEQFPFLLKVRSALLVPLLGGLWIATARSGLVAAIAVVVGVVLAERLLLARRVARILDLSWADRGLFADVGKLLAAAVVAGIAADTLRRILLGYDSSPAFPVLITSAVLFLCVYLVTVHLLRVLTPEERGTIRRWLVRHPSL